MYVLVLFVNLFNLIYFQGEFAICVFFVFF